MTRNLAVFDFDHTIINDNSDTAVMKLVDNKIPREVKLLHRSDGWTAFMQGVFKTLHENQIQEDAINNFIKHLPAVQGMPELIKEMNESFNFDVIIISDSNHHFIDLWLTENNLKDHILKVFSNPANFEDGLLKINMYHLQDYCKLSTKNLCKGQIMEDFIAEQEQNGRAYKKIFYIGDGVNDFCPILRLKDGDVACVRDKYKCVDLVNKSREGKYFDNDGISRIVKSNVCVWQDGYEIMEFIKQQNGRCAKF